MVLTFLDIFKHLRELKSVDKIKKYRRDSLGDNVLPSAVDCHLTLSGSVTIDGHGEYIVSGSVTIDGRGEYIVTSEIPLGIPYYIIYQRMWRPVSKARHHEVNINMT